MAAGGHENVRGLDVAVNDTFLVGGIKSVRDLNTDFEECIHRERTSGNTVPERFTFEQLHHEEKLAFVFPDIVNRADVGVIQ